MGARNYAGAAAASTLSGSIASGTTSIPVTDGSTWPTGSASYVIDRGLAGEEKILATRTGNTLTASNRGYDGTSAGSHNSGATIEHVPTAVDFSEANAHVNASAAVHGLTGTVVGTTDSQTLTNKTLTSPTLNTPTISGAVGGAASFTGTTFDATSTIGGVSGTTIAADHALWTAFTPTLVGITLGNGSVSGRYKQIGKTLYVAFTFTAGSTTAYTAGFYVNLPASLVAATGTTQYLSGTLVVAGVSYPALGQAASGATSFQLLSPQSQTLTSLFGTDATHPAAWSAASNSSFALSGVIEVA